MRKIRVRAGRWRRGRLPVCCCAHIVGCRWQQQQLRRARGGNRSSSGDRTTAEVTTMASLVCSRTQTTQSPVCSRTEPGCPKLLPCHWKMPQSATRDVTSRSVPIRDENGQDTDGYHRYYICFHISVRIRIRIISTMSDRIRLDIDIINMRFEYSDTDTVSDVGYPDSDTDRSQPL